MLVSMKAILADANEHNYGVMAMNSINIEMARAGILAAIIFPVMLLAALTVKGNVDKARAHRVVTDEAAF